MTLPLEKPKVVLYLRVSTEKQDSSNQEPDVRRLALARFPLERFDHVVVREQESGAKADRPGWSMVMEQAHAGDVHAVIVWALDRISRNQQRLVSDVRRLDRFGVALISFSESWCDTTSPEVRALMLPIFGWIAESKLRHHKNQTRAGMDRAAREGRHPGRPAITVPAHVRALALELRRGAIPWRRVHTEVQLKTGWRGSLALLMERCSEMGPQGGPSNPAPDAGRREAIRASR